MPPKKKAVQNKKATPTKAKAEPVKKVVVKKREVQEEVKDDKQTDEKKEEATEVKETIVAEVTTEATETEDPEATETEDPAEHAEEATEAEANESDEEATEAAVENAGEEATEAEAEDVAAEVMEEEQTKEPGDEKGDGGEACEEENEGNDGDNEPEEEADEENGVEIIKEEGVAGDDDVIIIDHEKDVDACKAGSDKAKPKEKGASWVDIIEKESDGKLCSELDKINKLITANQKGKEIMSLARTHRVHMYPVYPEDMANPFIVDVMKKCTQTNVRFCSSKNAAGEDEFTGFLELSFIRKNELEDTTEKLRTLREGMKFLVGAAKNTVDDFTNDWKEVAGLPGNADSNNKLTLFAPSLPECVTNDELWELFGKAREIWLVPGAPRQHAYIKFANEENLQATIEELKARGPPRKEFSFCRLVRFYDVQRVIRLHSGPSRFRRDSAGTGRLSHLKIKSPRDPRERSKERERTRKTSPSNTASSSQSKDFQSSKDQKPEVKTTEGDKSDISEKPKPESSDKPKSDKPKSDVPKSDAPKSDKPKSDKPKSDKPKSDKPKSDKPKSDKPKSDKPNSDKPKSDKPKSDKLKSDSSKSDKPKARSRSAERGDRKHSRSSSTSRGRGGRRFDRDRSSRFSPVRRGYVPGNNRIGRDNPRGSQEPGSQNMRPRRPMDRPPLNDRQGGRFHDDRLGSILGEPPMVPSLIGPPMMNNSSLEMSLNQLHMPMQPQMQPQIAQQQHQQHPMQQQRMHDNNQQQSLQVLDSLLSTLGQLSHQTDNPVKTLANVLQSTKGYDEGPRHIDHDERSYIPDAGGSAVPPRRDERRGRSPLKRAASPRRLSPHADMDIKRRREMAAHNTSAPMDRSQDYGRDMPRDTYNQTQPARSIADAYNAVPRRTEPQAAQRRDNFADDFQRRTAPMSNMSNRGFDNLQQSRAPVDSYEQQSRQSRGQNPDDSNFRTAEYATLRAEATGDISRMENEYSRLMDQIGQTPGNSRPSSGSYRPSSYY